MGIPNTRAELEKSKTYDQMTPQERENYRKSLKETADRIYQHGGGEEPEDECDRYDRYARHH